MSAVRTLALAAPTGMDGLPMTVLSLTVVSRAPAAMKMPCVLPVTLLPSITFPEPDAITPMPKSSGGSG
jgi:hypothetical protein